MIAFVLAARVIVIRCDELCLVVPNAMGLTIIIETETNTLLDGANSYLHEGSNNSFSVVKTHSQTCELGLEALFWICVMSG